MCGIAGLLNLDGAPVSAALLQDMTDSLSHRGPDGEGRWTEGHVGFGHRRLAIVDLSPSGRQPMTSHDGRYVLTFNGEIYNHVELRREVEGAGAGAWRGHSDTETLLEAIALWGLEAAIGKSVGMFALALWDRRERRLLLARDRFGEKPLYYGWAGRSFLFASELKALRRHPRFVGEISRSALRLLAARAYVPAPLSIYEHVYKLPPGCILTIAGAGQAARPVSTIREGGDVSIARYWSYRDVVAEGLRNPIEAEEEALEQLEQALAASIGGQSVADVPLGAFLSGGIDSSTVVALYQKHSARPIRTFSIGFEEAAFNEAEYAKEVARHFGTDHDERYVTAREAREVIPLLPAMYDEPFGDSSQIPTHLVSRFARGQVTVALSGDGGDELFGGYNRYFLAAELWRRMNRLPGPVRSLLGASLGKVPPAAWNRLVNLLPGASRPPHFGMKVQKALRTMSHASRLDDIYNSFLDEWTMEGSPVLGTGAAPALCPFDLDAGGAAPDTVRMMYCDAVSYLPDDILAKVDRAAMAVSLETRVPFLDHRLAAVAARIPLRMKIGEGRGKNILRKLLYRHAPQRLFDRPKTGFGIPVGAWIRGPLREWAEDMLEPRRLREEGYFDPSKVEGRWQQHKRGEVDHVSSLWPILMFQAWKREDDSGRRLSPSLLVPDARAAPSLPASRAG
jgi:asparagine synthase (glutamine-hydrolysing)